jgi:hypothetical protein
MAYDLIPALPCDNRHSVNVAMIMVVPMMMTRMSWGYCKREAQGYYGSGELNHRCLLINSSSRFR